LSDFYDLKFSIGKLKMAGFADIYISVAITSSGI